MTEKRFKVYDDEFSKHIEDTYYTEDKHEHNLYDIWEMCHKLNELFTENEQLKQFKEKVFVLIDKEIIRNEEAMEWGEKQGGDVGAMGFHTNMLKILRKKLKE